MRPQPIASLLAVSAAAVLVSSCSVGPNYQEPRAAVPARFSGTAQVTAPPAGALPVASQVTGDAADGADWWTHLHDPTLNSLEARAASGNLDLQVAADRIAESRAEARKAGAQGLPSLNATGGFARIDAPNLSLSSSQNGGLVESIWTAGFDASWELDVFGSQRRQVEAAKAGYEAQLEDRRKAEVSVTAEVAQNYLQLRGLQERQAIADKNLALEEDTLRLTQSLRRSGFTDDLQVRQAETEVAQTRAGRIPLDVAVQQEEHALALLLGLPPTALAGELDRPVPLPTLPSSVAIGIPSELLRRRPDIREAERQMAVANAQVGAAIAAYYPKFSLTGLIATDSPQFDGLFDFNNRLAVIYPSVTWNLLDFGKTRSQVEAQKAKYHEATLAYRSAVLVALREVEDALSAYVSEQEHYQRLKIAEVSARSAVDLSRDQYRQGVIDLLHVLDAQRQLLQIEDSVAQSEQAMATNFVALYKALGGGWEISARGT